MSKWKAKTVNNMELPDEEPYISQSEDIIKSNDDLATEFGFFQDTIKNLFDGLNQSINLGEPFFIWSRKRQNEKLKLNNEKLVLIHDQIKNLQAISDEFLKLKAQAIFSSEYLKNLVEEKYMLAQQYFERRKEEHLTAILSEQAKRKHIGHELSEREIAQRKSEAEIRKLNGEAAQAEAIAAEIQAGVDNTSIKTKILDKFLESFDSSTLDPKHISQIVISTVIPNTNIIDFDFEENRKNNLNNAEKAKVDMLNHQAKEQELKNKELEERNKRNERNRQKL